VDSELNTFLEQSPENFRELLAQMHLFVRQVVPDAIPHQYRAGDKLLLYSTAYTAEKEICYLRPFSKHINFGFSQGTHLPDPSGLLEGTGKNFRHIKIKNATALENPAVRALLEVAWQRYRELNP
jgi:hypothetical protein